MHGIFILIIILLLNLNPGAATSMDLWFRMRNMYLFDWRDSIKASLLSRW